MLLCGSIVAFLVSTPPLLCHNSRLLLHPQCIAKTLVSTIILTGVFGDLNV